MTLGRGAHRTTPAQAQSSASSSCPNVNDLETIAVDGAITRNGSTAPDAPARRRVGAVDAAAAHQHRRHQSQHLATRPRARLAHRQGAPPCIDQRLQTQLDPSDRARQQQPAQRPPKTHRRTPHRIPSIPPATLLTGSASSRPESLHVNSILPRQEAFLVDAPRPKNLTTPVDSGLERAQIGDHPPVVVLAWAGFGCRVYPKNNDMVEVFQACLLWFRGWWMRCSRLLSRSCLFARSRCIRWGATGAGSRIVTCSRPIVFRLVTGCSWDVAGRLGRGGETTLRTRYNAWNADGVFDRVALRPSRAMTRIVGRRFVRGVGGRVVAQGALRGRRCWQKPWCRGKSGWKWSLLCDRAGIPVSWAADGANRNDQTLLGPTLAAAGRRGLLADVETLHLDRGYAGDPVLKLCEATASTTWYAPPNAPGAPPAEGPRPCRWGCAGPSSAPTRCRTSGSYGAAPTATPPHASDNSRWPSR